MEKQKTLDNKFVEEKKQWEQQVKQFANQYGLMAVGVCA